MKCIPGGHMENVNENSASRLGKEKQVPLCSSDRTGKSLMAEKVIWEQRLPRKEGR